MLRKCCLLLMFILVPGLVHAAWDEAWSSRAKVTVNAAGVATAQEQVPVVLRLHSGNFDFSSLNLDGSDLRVIAADDKTELKFHIEKFDSINELAVIWVLLPKVDAADKGAHFWLYSGNESAISTADSQDNWDNATVAVFHFAEKTFLQDSRGGLVASGTPALQKAALIGEAAIFAGQAISIAANPSLALSAAQGLTYSAWIKPANTAGKATLYQQGPVAFQVADGKLEMKVGNVSISGGEVKPATWQHVAVTIGAGKAVLYLNGAVVANGDASLTDVQDAVQVGAGYQGELDELELANTARSADWIKLAATGQSMDSQLLKVQAADAEAEEEGGSSHFMVLFHSLTVDAWVVIVILTIMFVISVVVMVAKARQVVLIDKANRIFLKLFNEAGNAQLLELDKAANTGASTLARLYMAGLREIRKRYTADGQLSLSGASMDAIKAAIDADLIRENKSLNANIVLLTIAISGGPFLGLLGTVIGVMITFAEIAAAGDVNVNAIAPGIAAALMATVAGLAVAIPALFGYNYLSSRIKNINTDMQIFVDEYVTRVAELYGK
ncbi:DUF2341 domain-containing protein [Methylobacillus gramineus]|uniref:DUF2341 domain-containing protein n=1 Tax=Methylobacillus gramineus TaxID=755169 RepID=UPI001CFF924D|nr:DUF2341 domain-containing protein [Methylobacillus gramineus]MCB5186043.1 DUF2341 domain-containing protein [Methylobacillus gramineus]